MTQPRRPEEGATVAVLIPLRQLQDGERPVVVRRVGRPRRVESAPTISQAAYHAAIAAEVHRAVAQDDVVVATSGDDPKLVIERTMVAVASEAASLLWERERAQREGRAEADRISTRRVAALVRLADLVLVHEEMRRANPELDPQDIATVLGMIMADAEEVLAGVAPAAVAEKFLDSIKARMAAARMPCRTTP